MIMKTYKLSVALLLSASLLTASCSSDEPSSESIFKTEKTEQTDFDKWLYANFTEPYNIQFLYRYSDKETDNTYNVIPADPEKAKALAIMVRHMWIQAYEEVAGKEFIKAHGPKIYELLGSPEYNTNGSIVLGYAESGVKIVLFRVNEIDINNPYVNLTEPFRSHSSMPLDLNYWYFHTMHHEFFHILTQLKNYSTDYQTISAGHYHSSDWVNVSDKDAPKEGFVTGYASGEYNEDIAEMYSTYVTSTDEAWNQILDAALIKNGDTVDDTYRNVLIQKLEMVRSYLNDSWGIDLEKLRSVILRRSQEVTTLDLKTLN